MKILSFDSVRSIGLVLLLTLTATAQVGNRPLPPIEAVRSEHTLSLDELQALTGKQADIRLLKGSDLKNATIEEIVTVGQTPKVKLIVAKPEGEPRPKRLIANQIHQLKIDENAYLVNFLPSQKASVIQDQARRKGAVETQLLGKGNIWEEMTDEEHAEAVADDKEFLQKVTAYFSKTPMRLTETKYFLFLTDMPPAQVAPYIVQLDKMNETLGTAFGFPAGYNIWRGKAVVIVFTERLAFEAFEREFMSHIPGPDVQALCHSFSDGRVVVGCYRGDDPSYFGIVLVHETTHGYVHRYYSSIRIPSWLNEGMSDWAAQLVVPRNESLRQRQAEAQAILKQQGSLGAGFLTSDQIDGWQYGTAAMMVAFLVRQGPDQFKTFIDGIKEGHQWEASLQRAYGITPQELVVLFGRSIGIPQLSP